MRERKATISRRGFNGAPLGAAAAPLAAEPSRPLVPWMYMIYPIEQWLSDYPRTLDAWEAGGVRGLVIGPRYSGRTRSISQD